MPFSSSAPLRGLDAYSKDDELSEIGSELAELPSPFSLSVTVVYENQGGSGRRIPPPASIRGRIERGIADLSGISLQDLPETRAEVEEIVKSLDRTP